MRNADAPWEAFDPSAWVAHNYSRLQSADEEILRIVGKYFVDHFREQAAGPVSGVDVGAGANLYPALAMLPWCDEITLFEYSPVNVAYLRRQVDFYDPDWDQFWDVLRESEEYDALGTVPRRRFAEVVKVEQGDIFDLERHEGRWSLGTMFFVAESMTTSHQEFTLGVERFLRALAPGAPFAAAFMEHSRGHHAGEHFFPARDVGKSEVYASIEPFACDLEVERIGASSGLLRSGYTGMILARGRRDSSDMGIPDG